MPMLVILALHGSNKTKRIANRPGNELVRRPSDKKPKKRRGLVIEMQFVGVLHLYKKTKIIGSKYCDDPCVIGK